MTNRILVVEDETDFAELLQFRLRQLAYEVTVAASGLEALNQARRELPDLIVMDLLLPDLDGLSVCEIMRRQSSTRDIPVIVLTALSSEKTRELAQLAGACAFFTKPVDFAALCIQIETVLAPPALQFGETHSDS